MSTEVIFSIDDSIVELFLFFIDDERNKDIEKKFATYLNEYFNFKEKNDSLSSESGNNEEEIANEQTNGSFSFKMLFNGFNNVNINLNNF